MSLVQNEEFLKVIMGKIIFDKNIQCEGCFSWLRQEWRRTSFEGRVQASHAANQVKMLIDADHLKGRVSRKNILDYDPWGIKKMCE